MARKKEERRLTAAPRVQWSFESVKMFKWLPADSKEKAFGRYYQWLKTARQKNVQYRELDLDTSDLGEKEIDLLESIVENTCDGFDALWSRTKQDEEQSQTASDCPRLSQTAMEGNKGMEINESTEEMEERNPSFPTLDEVKQYVQEKGYTFLADSFYQKYAKEGLKNWKAMADRWQQMERPKKEAAGQKYTQRNYDEQELEKELHVNDIYKADYHG